MSNELRTPYKDILPVLSTEEFDALRERIVSEGGIHDPVLITESDEILDGHNRYSLDKSAPIKIISGSKGWSDARKKAFVVRSNLARRNLSAEQIREVVKPIVKELKQEGLTQAEIAKLIGVSRPTISKWLGSGHNVPGNNMSSSLDCRIKVPADSRRLITDRLSAGEVPEKIAADFKVSVKTVKRIVAKQSLVDQQQVHKSLAAEKFQKNGRGILTGDATTLFNTLNDNSVDLFFTDPPYAKESLNNYVQLADLAAQKLRPGGLCLAYTGHFGLPDVMKIFSDRLEYWWIFAIRFSGASCAIFPRKIQNSWRPVVAFCKPPAPTPQDWLSDILSGGGREKDHHDWQQAESEAEYLIRKLTKPDDLVVDPFCGGRTIPVAAKKLGRKWLGTEIDGKTAAIARNRLADG